MRQCVDNVVGFEHRQIAYFFDANGSFSIFENTQNDASPVASVAHQPKVGQGSFGGTNLAFEFTQFITKLD